MADEITTDHDEQDSSLPDGLGREDPGYISSEQKRPVSTGTLLMAGLLLISGAGIWMLREHFGPRSAQADEVSTQTISGFLNGGQHRLRQMERMLNDTQKVVQRFINYPSVTQVPLQNLRGNPFRHESLKAKPDVEAPVAARAVHADEAARRQREARDKAVAEARDLARRLQSVVSGNRPACMIDGKLYEPGQQVGAFTVESIDSQAVVVRQGDFRFSLKMSGGR